MFRGMTLNQTLAKRSSGSAYRPLVLAACITLFAAALINVSLFTRDHALSELYTKAQTDIDSYQFNVEQRLIRYKTLTQLFSGQQLLLDAVKPGSDDSLRQAANSYLQDAADLLRALDIYVMDTQGVTQTASNWFKADSFIGKNFSFRPYFTDAMAGREGSYFALGITTNKRGYYFSYPMQDEGQIIGAAVVKIDLDEIEEQWNDPASEILVTDTDSIVVISSRPDWMFKTLRPLSTEQMERITESLRYGDQSLDSLDIVYPGTSQEGLELVTVLNRERLDQPSMGEASAQQYFRLSRPLADTDLQVNLFVSLAEVDARVLTAQGFTASGFALLLLGWVIVFQRRRIRNERLRFEQRELLERQVNDARIAGIINNTNAGLSLMDSDGCIEYFNPFLERLFGYNLQELIGQPFSGLLSDTDRPLMQEYVMREIDTRDQYLCFEAECTRLNGSHFPAELTLSSMLLGERYHLIVTLVDISERRKNMELMEHIQIVLEQRVENRTADLQAANERLLAEVDQHHQTQNELIQATKLAVIGQMATGINHELNQPLTAIRNYADNAVKLIGRGAPDRAAENLKAISGLTERMAHIIHPLKEFARKSNDRRSNVCLKELREGTTSLLYGHLEKLGVIVNWPDNLESYRVLGDLLRLEQVFVNLINNAIQAMENSAEKRVDIWLDTTEPEWAVIVVQDTGPGLSVEAREQIFEPFFTTKSEGQGLGLGLSISQRIVRSMDGELSVDESSTGGAEFRVYLRKAQPIDQPRNHGN